MVAAAPQPASAAPWSAQFAVEESPGSNFTDARVWAAQSGRVAVTWTSFGGGPASAWLRLYEPAGGWHAAARIGTNLFSVPRVLAAAFTAEGNLWVAYDSDAENPSIKLALYDPGRGLGAAVSFDSHAEYGVAAAEMVADADGGVTLVWAAAKDSDGRLLASTSAAGSGAWSTPVRLDNASGQVRDFDLTVFGGGDVAVVWSVDASPRQELWTARTASGGLSWNAPLRLRDEAAASILEPRIAAGAPDTISITWIERPAAASAPLRLVSTTRVGGVGWSAEAQVAAADRVAHAQMASAPEGRALVVWEQSMGGGTVTCFSHGDPAGNWTAPVALHEGPGSSKAPSVAAGPAGAAWAVWSVVAADGLSLWGRRYSPSGGWEPGERLTAGPHSSSESPGIAVDGRGAAWAVWTDFSETGNSVAARAASLPAGEDISRVQGGARPPSPVDFLLVPLALTAVAVVAIAFAWRRPR